MPDMQKVVETKSKILDSIKNQGPTYPAQIARHAGLSPLFTAAFLSELVKDRKLKISNMKIGSSPIYYIPGQEAQLENFTQHLNSKEREAFEKLKSEEMLQDEDQEPAIRVALRKIKDFAIPIQARIDGENKLFWRYSQFPESQSRDKIRTLLSPSNYKPKPKLTTPEEPDQSGTNPPLADNSKEKQLSDNSKENNKEKPKEENQQTNQPLQDNKNQSRKSPTIPKTSEFAESIKDYLAAKDMEILEEISAKKKEFQAKVRADTIFGKQEYLLSAKDKKKITQNDLTIATQNAQARRMQALIISPGELDKNAKSYLENWRNLLKFDKIKL